MVPQTDVLVWRVLSSNLREQRGGRSRGSAGSASSTKSPPEALGNVNCKIKR